jgi:acyl phosphate:glycerol-3-phosphate acyltransferase
MTDNLLWSLALIVGAYFVGATPIGYLLVKIARGEDIRQFGSGNIGATNVGRLMGRKWGALVWFLDAVKGCLPCLAAGIALGFKWGSLEVPPLVVACGLMGIIGNMFPIYLKFRGGKGVSTSCGAFLYIFPWGCLIAMAVWGIALALTRYVSVSSILAAMSLAIAAMALPEAPMNESRYLAAVCFLAAALVIVRHYANIKRLIAGTEKKIGAGKPPA